MRLVAFGCSLTYGHGLSDCWDHELKQPAGKPSAFAWPAVAARQHNLDCVNTSFPGASNKEILFKIQNFDFQPDDIVTILWTFPGRSCIIQSDKNIFDGRVFDHNIFDRIVPGNTDLASKHYYLAYDDIDARIDFYTRIEYANLYFKSRGIKAFHFLIEQRLVATYSWLTTELETVYMCDIKNRHSTALDGEHPSEPAHHEFGLEVAKRINSFISC